MKDFAKSVRTGNAYIRGQKVGTDGKYEYVINDVMQDGTIMVSRHPDGRTFTFSSEQEVKDWLRNSKIGNATIDPKDDTLRKLEDELRGWLKTYDSKDPNVDKANVEKNIREIRAEIEKYKRKNKIWNESIDKQEWSMFNGLRKKAESEIGNAYKENPELTKILEAWLHNRIKEEEAREKILKITGDKNITDMMIRKPGGFIPVGNATGDEYNSEIQRLTKKAEQLRRMGQGRQAMEVEKQIEKLGKELHELGNKKTGNAGEGWYTFVGPKSKNPKYKEGQPVKTREGKGTVTKVQPMKLSGTPTYKVKLESGKEIWCYEEEIGNKIGNEETKAERKFGKVMGEFEEGALKTPQGKTVTDPAQAKAIAYSEADKVDNLKRARNAMNKKVKNSSVREYKDSQGRIAQIDFNSDGTDADLAIYEDERMSKSVEQRNFSTIRDAEQYVQSHGFRRVG